MPKRKSTQAELPAAAEPSPSRRRSLRLSELEAETAPEKTEESEPETEPEDEPLAKKTRSSRQTTAATKAKVKPVGKKQQAPPAAAELPKPAVNGKKSKKPAASAATKQDEAVADEERNYWLLKAEPETRLENGVDVRFSIDDLAAKKEPEPWDGIRNYVARNNLRAMKKGDLAFFYHSNCKEPGIVGTMEIVAEHSPDLSAHDPKAPYYDAKSSPSDPKWSVVHVAFRSKFASPIGLKELRTMGAPGKPLENMQMLKQSRLSVSKVNAAEWAYLISVAEERGGA
ncbi:PUA-like domain-containing protein [Apodospora peruviana]|uniref:Thymocyte nuclear protein 1 n=1 Tax=Apodospora peruviana TaxID=516989 RepID=A0AAE0LZ11_9PEZI|nr:PUA-like domain-containing protein [Apodospora peruviana]